MNRLLPPALLLWATCILPAQGVVNASLLAPLPDTAAIAALRQQGMRHGFVAARPAVVHVAVAVTGGRNDFRIERPSSGVVLTPQGLVLTWWSLVREAEGASDKNVLVQLGDVEPRELPARIVAHDDASGLALLQVRVPDGVTLSACAMAAAAPPAGTPAIVIGYGDGKDVTTFAGVVGPAVGGTSIDGRTIAAADLLVTDAMIDLRCQGAALVDEQGHLLGLCNSEHVVHQYGEPTLAQLQAPSFGVVLPVAVIRRAFAKELAAVAPAPAAPPSAAAAAVAKVAPAVVSVWGGDGELPALGLLDPYATQRRQHLGSGVIVSNSGLVLTNLHLVEHSGAITVTLLDGRHFAARLEKGHAANNLAMLQLELPAGTALPVALCSGGEPILGETVLGVGNPFGHTPTVTVGALSQRRAGGMLQADPNLGNQNGGGALIDLSGQVCGIVDGGAVDKIERAFRRQGDEAKTETNLSTCLSIAAIRTVFAGVIAKAAAADESIRAPLPVDLGAREDATTRMVHDVAGAMLNVYISWTSAPADLEANPFASVKEPEIRTQSLGSGVIIDGSGLALTNWHVVDDATEEDGSMRQDHVVHVRTFDGKIYEAKVLSISREDDLALLQLVLPEGQRLPAVQLGSSEALQPGETVVAIGNPHGFANTITKGIVCAKDQGIKVRGRWAEMENLLEIDAAINGGNSGGALLDIGGRLVGINSAGSHGASSRGYAIPVDHVRKQVLELLLSPQKLRSQNLGMMLGDQDGKVVVQIVDPYGPAARAGVVAGDAVAAFGSVPITWSVGFAMTLLRWPQGQPVELQLQRDGKARQVSVVPMPAPIWAVHRQTGLDLQTVGRQQEPALVQAAWTALQRAFTGDSTAVPADMPESVLRVERIQPGVQRPELDVQPGDLLLAVELYRAGTDGQSVLLRRLPTADDAMRLFDDRQVGSYDGRTLRCWLYRDGKTFTQELVATRRKLWERG